MFAFSNLNINNDEMNILCKCICAHACIYLEDKFLNQNDCVKVDVHFRFLEFLIFPCINLLYHKF